MNGFILALDIGTSSVRAALYDRRAEMIAETSVKNERRLSETDDGGAEIDANEALRQVENAIDDVLQRAGDRTIETVAASSFWHSLVGIDPNGDPTTKVFAWGEKRPARYVSKLRADLDESAVHNRTGARFHSSFWPAKLLWLKNEFPDDWRRTTQWISFSDLVALRFSGRLGTGVSMASATGIFDQRVCDWDPQLLNYLGISAKMLPPVAAADTETFVLGPEYAARWPKLANASWFHAIGDGAANNLGAGCDRIDTAALMIGTSGAMRVAYAGDVPERIPSGLWCYRIDRERVIVGGALSDGGGLFRWLKDNLKLNGSDDEIEAEIARRPPAGHGLTFLPFLFGERSTGYHENASGAVLGMRSTTDAVDIVQAGLESVAYRFAEIFEQLSDIGEIKTIVASGGALRESPVWTQIIADVIGRDMFLPETREASSRGAVLFALRQLGSIGSDSEHPSGKEFKSDPSRKALYTEGRSRHRQAYDFFVR